MKDPTNGNLIFSTKIMASSSLAHTAATPSNSSSEESTLEEDPPTTPPSRKRSAGGSVGGRRQLQKRVVSVVTTDGEASCPAAPDHWAWRKYGQKPIKGSPYPRGYYRCSSSKGCPARKQVERNRANPGILLVTYTAEHNHPWPLPRERHHQQQQQQQHQNRQQQPAAEVSSPKEPPEIEKEEPPALSIASTSSADEAHELAEESFLWFSGAQEETLLVSDPICSDALDDLGELGSCGDGWAEGEEELFEGLGELPEWSVLFGRGVAAGKVRMPTAASPANGQ